MKRGETRTAYEQRMREEMRNRAINRLKDDEQFIVLQLQNVRRKLTKATLSTERSAP